MVFCRPLKFFPAESQVSEMSNILTFLPVTISNSINQERFNAELFSKDFTQNSIRLS